MATEIENLLKTYQGPSSVVVLLETAIQLEKKLDARNKDKRQDVTELLSLGISGMINIRSYNALFRNGYGNPTLDQILCLTQKEGGLSTLSGIGDVLTLHIQKTIDAWFRKLPEETRSAIDKRIKEYQEFWQNGGIWFIL